MNIKNEKRKWQIALRRYVVEKAPSVAYAKYFGLDIESFRQWIALQFTKELSWNNFGEKWQLDHIVPVSYFNFSNQEDLILCWSFINTRVKAIEQDKDIEPPSDILAAKNYFEDLYNKTNYPRCLQMANKLKEIEKAINLSNNNLELFIKDNQFLINSMENLDESDIARLNSGTSLQNIIGEKEIVKKFG